MGSATSSLCQKSPYHLQAHWQPALGCPPFPSFSSTEVAAFVFSVCSHAKGFQLSGWSGSLSLAWGAVGTQQHGGLQGPALWRRWAPFEPGDSRLCHFLAVKPLGLCCYICKMGLAYFMGLK